MEESVLKHGDFTELAKNYVNRPGYSLLALDVISTFIKRSHGKNKLIVADVGAGTGKLTENLCQLGFSGYAVEPNDAMRIEGMKYIEGKPFQWFAGSAERTTLPDACVEWVTMGSSFHWTDAPAALEEFARILKPGGFFTAIWNPRDIERSEFHKAIEEKIHTIVPGMQRVSSGASQNSGGIGGSNAQSIEERLLKTPFFGDLIFSEAPHTEIMSKERYMGAWRSVNDIRVQAGEEKFRQILDMIEKEIEPLDVIEVPYKSRAWTVRRV